MFNVASLSGFFGFSALCLSQSAFGLRVHHEPSFAFAGADDVALFENSCHLCSKVHYLVSLFEYLFSAAFYDILNPLFKFCAHEGVHNAITNY